MLAVVRPGSWNLPLFFHVAGAMVLVASLVVALYSIRIARQRGDQPAAHFAFSVLLRASLPAFIVMRVAAAIVQSKEHLDKHTPDWVGVGFGVSDFGLLLLIIGIVLTGLMARRAKQGSSVAGAAQLRVAGGLAGILLLAYVVAIWAMTTKPGS
jgi:cytochrome b561